LLKIISRNDLPRIEPLNQNGLLHRADWQSAGGRPGFGSPAGSRQAHSNKLVNPLPAVFGAWDLVLLWNWDVGAWSF
jgi:hypothetical protein